jgi:tetratricopeptide (TPR) repeat protein
MLQDPLPFIEDARDVKDEQAPGPLNGQRSRVRYLGLGCIAVGLWWSYPDGLSLGYLLAEQFALVVSSPGRIWWSPYSRAFWALVPMTLGGLLLASGSARFAKSATILMAALGIEGALSLILSAVFDSGWLKRKSGLLTATFDRLLPSGLGLVSAVALVIAALALSVWAMRINATWRRSVRAAGPGRPRLDRRPVGRLAIFGAIVASLGLMTSLGWQTYLNVLERASWLRGMILTGDRPSRTRQVARTRTPEEIRYEEASVTQSIGLRHQAEEAYDLARESFARAYKKFESLHEDVPENRAYAREYALAANNLAWFLTTCPDLSVRDPKTAVSLARRATAMDPLDGNAQNTLAVAYLDSKNLDAADEAFRRSMELRGGGDSFDWYFLARLEAARDHPREAQSWYEKAQKWHLAERPKDPELQRFRRDAALALGLPEPEIVAIARSRPLSRIPPHRRPGTSDAARTVGPPAGP